MNYHNITYPDMNNGDGLRVVLWLSGCSHHCEGCQNPQTWNHNSGIKFDDDAKRELFKELAKPYISGITFSGGDPLNEHNVREVYLLISEIVKKYPHKSVWVYSGYTWEEIFNHSNELNLIDNQEWGYRKSIILLSDVFVDGKFNKDLADVNYHWAGSTNQRIIDVKKTLSKNEIVNLP